MMIVLTENDFSRLKQASRADIMSVLLTSTAAAVLPEIRDESFNWEERVDLTPDQVEELIEGCAPQTVAGLKVIADHGPKITANLLEEVAGIENYGHFQGRVTKRTRTVTGDKHAYLLAWDDWTVGENAERGYGHYAVTDATFRSLRGFFGLD